VSGIGTDPEETGGLERTVQEARRAIYELLTPLPAWTADVVRDEVQRLERAVEARTREQVAREAASPDACQVHGFRGHRYGACTEAGCGHHMYADCHPNEN
jgi:hypothetical protein